jgi:hypothetical protein
MYRTCQNFLALQIISLKNVMLLCFNVYHTRQHYWDNVNGMYIICSIQKITIPNFIHKEQTIRKVFDIISAGNFQRLPVKFKYPSVLLPHCAVMSFNAHALNSWRERERERGGGSAQHSLCFPKVTHIQTVNKTAGFLLLTWSKCYILT